MTRGDGDDDAGDRLALLIAVWVADIDADPIPELVDVDTAVRIIRGADDDRS